MCCVRCMPTFHVVVNVHRAAKAPPAYEPVAGVAGQTCAHMHAQLAPQAPPTLHAGWPLLTHAFATLRQDIPAVPYAQIPAAHQSAQATWVGPAKLRLDQDRDRIHGGGGAAGRRLGRRRLPTDSALRCARPRPWASTRMLEPERPRTTPGGLIAHVPSSAGRAARECLHRRHAVRVPVPVVLHRRPADECWRGANLAHCFAVAVCGYPAAPCVSACSTRTAAPRVLVLGSRVTTSTS